MWGNTDHDWLPGQTGPANGWNAATSQELGPDLRIQKLYPPLCHTGRGQASAHSLEVPRNQAESLLFNPFSYLSPGALNEESHS